MKIISDEDEAVTTFFSERGFVWDYKDQLFVRTSNKERSVFRLRNRQRITRARAETGWYATASTVDDRGVLHRAWSNNTLVDSPLACYALAELDGWGGINVDADQEG